MDSIAESERLVERRKLRSRESAEQTGETILDLAIEDNQTGLGGRYLLTFVKRNRERNLPWNRLKVGSPVIVTSTVYPDDRFPGVVSGRDYRSIQVALNEWPTGDRFDIDLSPDEVTRNRQRSALQEVRQARGRLGDLRDKILGERPPTFGKAIELTSPDGTADLNPSQVEAIEFALTAEDLAIIHGPPGTGKTTSVVRFICKCVANGEKVLACAPSNTAVDNLLERLVAAGQRVVRLGHPARVMTDLREYTLDAMVESHENMRWVKELMQDAERLFKKAGKYTRARPARGAKQDMRREAKQLKTEARKLEQQAVQHVLDQADVICATTTLDEDLLGKRHFDWTVIDEACQTTEPACWIPIRRGERLLLAGDHCQLPPTIVSKEAAREGFAVSMMERLMGIYGDDIHRLLKVQYRMHQQIMDFSSQQFYDGALVADDSVASHLLSQLPHLKLSPGDLAENPLTESPLMFVDTAGADFDEELEPEGSSRLNPKEANLVLEFAQQLMDAGLPPTDIAIIAPYAAQVRRLRQQATDSRLEVDTVDGFQGREKEAVIISLVRSNRENEIGFLADTRRMNVALTRARRKLIVIGDSATLGGNEFYAAMLEYFEQAESYHSVWEFMHS